jgi:succinate-semialdehyde dehydrogenase/glutarate-semialdehyde dehydrogenase
MSIVTVNPTTGRRLRSYTELGPVGIERAMASASLAFAEWRERTFAGRARALRSVSAVLGRRRETLARLATREMGKPLAEARAEVEKCRLVCRYYAQHGRAFLADERPVGAPRGARVIFEPMGPLLAVMPWNFPYWQVFRAAAPALMAGNTMLLKHAPM